MAAYPPKVDRVLAAARSWRGLNLSHQGDHVDEYGLAQWERPDTKEKP